MAADQQPAHAAHAAASPSPPRSPDLAAADLRPAWARGPPSSRRLSSRPHAPHHLPPRPAPWHARLLHTARAAYRHARRLFLSLTPLQRCLAALAGAAALAFVVAALVFGHRAFGALGAAAKRWRAYPLGWAPVWLLVVATGFPPLIGYSSAVMVAGFVYGFPWGWPLAASATVCGSTVAFLASRGAFAAYVHRLVGRDTRFVAFAQVLRRDGVGMLTLIRFCPLPYSLSNGFLATIPSVSTGAFVLSTALSTPKLLVHVFIGSRLAVLAEKGDDMSAGDRAINLVSMWLSSMVGLAVAVVVYRRTRARAAELSLEEPEDLEGGAAAGLAPGEGREADEDEAAGLVDADADAAALVMDDDDISLWEGAAAEGTYRDEWDGEEGVGGGVPEGDGRRPE